MKRCLLLFTKGSANKGMSDPVALVQLLSETNSIAATWAYLDDLLYYYRNGETPRLYDTKNNAEITDYDVVYFRYWGDQQGHAIAAARICKILDVPFVDTEVLRTGSLNKITQYANLLEAGVAIPATLIASVETLAERYAEYGFGYPFIMKHASGTRGQDNFLVHDKSELQRLLTKFAGQTFVLQEYLPNDGDFRVIVMGEAVRLVIRRTAHGETHLNNTSQGGSAEIVPNDTLPVETLEECVRAAAFYGRDIAGVDIVQSKTDGKYYCFEVNRAPQIEHASFEHEKAALLADYLSSL